MALSELIFVIFILYLLYKLVFNLIVPVSRAASSVRDQMRNMQNQQAMQQQGAASYTTTKSKNNSTATTDSEYIDFEEIK